LFTVFIVQQLLQLELLQGAHPPPPAPGELFSPPDMLKAENTLGDNVEHRGQGASFCRELTSFSKRCRHSEQ